MSWLRRNAVVIAFVVINIAIATPANAALQDASCSDGQGGEFACCKSCIIFCGCEIINE